MDLGGLFVRFERRYPLVKLVYLLLGDLLDIFPEPLLPLAYPLYLLINLAHFLGSRASRHDIKSLLSVHLLVLLLLGGRRCHHLLAGCLGPGDRRRVDSEARRSPDPLVVLGQGVRLAGLHVNGQHFKHDIFHLLLLLLL